MNERQKIKAVELMCRLELSTKIIEDFMVDDKVYVFEEFGSYDIKENSVLVKKMKEQEEKGSVVYAVTHEIAPFGELYDFFIVPKYEEDWERLMQKIKVSQSNYITTVIAYVWNKTDEERSEPGTIVVECFKDNLRRIV